MFRVGHSLFNEEKHEGRRHKRHGKDDTDGHHNIHGAASEGLFIQLSFGQIERVVVRHDAILAVCGTRGQQCAEDDVVDGVHVGDGGWPPFVVEPDLRQDNKDNQGVIIEKKIINTFLIQECW